jgi:FtsP/CotA-like multicopper oxidase with cupredoxin domain
MKYEELVHFLERQMSMSHVYQPLLVRALVDSGGNATLPQLAQVFLTQDESQLLYYEKRIREIPLKAHKRHGVIVADGQIMSLTAYPMTGEVMPAAFHVQEGKRYRIHMRNASDDIHPIHLHRHIFELTSVVGMRTSGVMKDVLMLGGYQEAEIDFVAVRAKLRLSALIAAFRFAQLI